MRLLVRAVNPARDGWVEDGRLIDTDAREVPRKEDYIWVARRLVRVVAIAWDREGPVAWVVLPNPDDLIADRIEKEGSR
jgi:hypothetical protein